MIFVKYTGRLGNNLFQWGFGRILSKLSGVPMSAPFLPLFPSTYGVIHSQPPKIKSILPMNCSFINIQEWVERASQEDILVQGWPHNTTFFEPHRDWLVKELTPEHGDYTQASVHDIVLHVRWGDFFGRHKKYSYPLKAFYGLLSSLEYDRCLIVTDTPDNELITNLVKNYHGTLIAKDINHDFRTLHYAPRLIMSPSTFSWWAAWSGKAHEIYQPYELGDWKEKTGLALSLCGQHVKRFDANGKILT